MAAVQTTIVSVTETAAYAEFATWSDNIFIDAGAVPAADIVYVTTDGSVPSATNFNYSLQGGQAVLVPNRQPKLNGLQYAGHGGLNQLPQAGGDGLTSQSVPGALWTSGYPVYVGVLLSTGTGSVGVEQR